MSPTMDIKKQCIGKSFFLKKVFFLLCNSSIFWRTIFFRDWKCIDNIDTWLKY
jgi:hypothetical protein